MIFLCFSIFLEDWYIHGLKWVNIITGKSRILFLTLFSVYYAGQSFSFM